MEPEAVSRFQNILYRLPIWRKRLIQVQPIEGGMTNFNFLVTAGKEKFVARFAPKTNALLGLERKREIANIRSLAGRGIAPRVVKFYPQYNLLIVRYIPGEVLSPDTCRGDTIINIALVLRGLHSLKNKFRGEFNPFDVVRKYIGVVQRRDSWLPEDIQKQLQELAQVEKRAGRFSLDFPCHLDLMMENLVQTERGIKILDWEYSANSDFRFDLAMLSVKGGFSYEDDRLLIQSYGLYDSQSYREIQLMKAAVYFREAAWGLLQLAVSKIEFDYKKYALENLQGFQSIIAG